MIKTVVKRNGQEEAFDPNKLSRWAEWASVVGVDWFEVVGEAYKKCQDKVSTEELHQALIRAAEDGRTTNHLLMAGRLMIGELYKQVFGGVENIPTLKQHYKKMVAEGFMEDMGYTDEELDYLGTVINHEKDFSLASNQVRQDIQKYLISDIVDKKPKETPQFAVMRQAMGACKNEKIDKLKRVEALYNYIADSKINTPTPNKQNLGTRKTSYASCCKSIAEDNLGSMEAQNHIYWTMTAAGAGQGGGAFVRSLGDKIRGGVIKHGGKLPYFRNKETTVKANLQGSRGGALTEYINALDPEIFVLLALRNPTSVDDKRIDGIDYAFQYNESFVERAKHNKPWLLISYLHAPDLWKAFFDEDMAVFDSLMDKYIASGKGEVIEARELLKKFLTENEVTGRLYEFNATNVNRHKAFKETIYTSNLCVTPETKVLTKQGHIPIAELVGMDVEVWNGEEWSNTTIVKTGENQEIVRVVTKDGYELECTPYHKFYKVVQDKWNRPVSVEVRAIDLKKGDKLIKFDLPVIQGDKLLPYAWANGFFSGDGYVHEGKSFIAFYHGKQKLIPLTEGCAVKVYARQESLDRTIVKLEGLQHKYFVPDCSYTVASRLEWLAGLLDSDGTLCINGETQSFQIGSINKEFLKEIQLMLQTCGVKSKVTKNVDGGHRMLPANDGSGENRSFMCQAYYRLLIGNDGVSKLLDLGLVTHRLKPTEHRPNRECSQFIKVEGVYSDGRVSDTYCFTEPKRHMGMFNGLLTGQCLEYLAPTKPYKNILELYAVGEEAEKTEGETAICNLAAISVGKTPLTFDKYYPLAFHTLLMVDNVIDVGTFPLPQVEYTAKARRTAGIGITNLAYAMASQGYSYSSQEGKDFSHRLAELHTYCLLKASVQLAKERGPCKWFDKTRYYEGWLPIDTYNKNVDNITKQPLLCDWEGLRAEIKKYGLRNSALVNHMPVESSSVRANDTNGLYPIREGIVLKKSGNTKVPFIPPEWESLQGWYEMAHDIPWKDLVDHYAIYQKFADQGISADMYYKFTEGNKTVNMSHLMEEFFYRNKVGMKTRYYRNFKIGASLVEQEESCTAGGCKL